jgi:AhpD family alkylhydroperoxidase
MTTHTTARLSFKTLAPQAFAALAGVGAAVQQSTLEAGLIDLIHLRISQLNGCAYCVDLHWREAIHRGEDLQRLNSLSTWRETSLYSPREEAALNWAERLTPLHASHPSDADFNALRPHFSDSEVVHLSFAIAAMNAWNRIGVGLRLPVVKKAVER